MLHGKNLIIALNGRALASSKSCNIKVSAQVQKISSPTDGQWEKYVPVRKEWEISTDHLVTDFVDDVKLVGGEYTLTCYPTETDYPVLPFDGILEEATVLDQSYGSTPLGIYWIQSEACFAGKTGSPLMYKYYRSWQGIDSRYINPSRDCAFLNSADGFLYRANDLINDLVRIQLEGNAICTSSVTTAAVLNIARGSFVFRGTGPLQ